MGSLFGKVFSSKTVVRARERDQRSPPRKSLFPLPRDIPGLFVTTNRFLYLCKSMSMQLYPFSLSTYSILLADLLTLSTVATMAEVKSHLMGSNIDAKFQAPRAFRDSEPGVQGFMAPSRFEGTITDLEVIGEVPSEISGTFYRVMPDPHYPAFVENDPVRHYSHFPLAFPADAPSVV